MVSFSGVPVRREPSASWLPVVVIAMLSKPPWAPVASPVIDALTWVPRVRGPATDAALVRSCNGWLAHVIVDSPQVESPTRQIEKPYRRSWSA